MKRKSEVLIIIIIPVFVLALVSVILVLLFSQNSNEKEMSEIYPCLIKKNPADAKLNKFFFPGNGIYYEYVLYKDGILESVDISKDRNKRSLQQMAMANLMKALHSQDAGDVI